MNEQLWRKYEDNLLNEGKSKRRIEKLKTMFNAIDRGLQMKLEQVTRQDIEQFVIALHRNTFKSEKGKNLSGITKSDIKKFLKQFYKWLKGGGQDYPEEVRWIKTNIAKEEKPQEKDTISLEEAVKLANSFDKIQYRIITLILFDSGFRIDELLSCNKKDLTWEEFEPGKECWWIKCNRSKTNTRKIPIPLFTEELNSFVNSASFQVMESNQPLFQGITYFAYNKALKINSLKVLKKKLSPHHMRHSSATHYAREFDGNMMQIADRYGWSYTSQELKLYIRRSGAYQRQGVKKTYDNEVVRLKTELDRMKDYLERELAEERENRKELTGLLVTLFSKELKKMAAEDPRRKALAQLIKRS